MPFTAANVPALTVIALMALLATDPSLGARAAIVEVESVVVVLIRLFVMTSLSFCCQSVVFASGLVVRRASGTSPVAL